MLIIMQKCWHSLIPALANEHNLTLLHPEHNSWLTLIMLNQIASFHLSNLLEVSFSLFGKMNPITCIFKCFTFSLSALYLDWLQHKSNDLKEMGDIYLDIIDYYESGAYLSDFR